MSQNLPCRRLRKLCDEGHTVRRLKMREVLGSLTA
jgi:hypothetical protein